MIGQIREGYMALLEVAKGEGSALDSSLRLADAFLQAPGDSAFEAGLRIRVQMWGEALRSPEIRKAHLAMINSARRPLAELVRRGQGQGEIDQTLDPDAAARVLIALYQGLVLQKALYGEMDVRKYREAAKAIVNGLARPVGSC